MKENKLVGLSMEFAVEIVEFCSKIKGKSTLTNQLLRCGTSIGANIHEANYAQSKADFISKLQISLKESYETEYWLELFLRTQIVSIEKCKLIKTKCGTLRKILISSINTTKRSL